MLEQKRVEGSDFGITVGTPTSVTRMALSVRAPQSGLPEQVRQALRARHDGGQAEEGDGDQAVHRLPQGLSWPQSRAGDDGLHVPG